jgi:serine/threonine protein phosphatase PrpC
VGDSRAYLVRDGRPALLTNDHTTVGDLVRLKLIGPDKVRTHAQRSMLNRAVGLGLFVRPEITRVKLRDEDRIVICSDGLWSTVEDRDLASMATASDDLDEVCSSLIGAAIKGDSDDNVSVIVVRVGRASSTQGALGTRGADRINGGLMKTLSALIRPVSANH